MSMLGMQADELRLMARLVRDYDYKEISRMLREAADTIESLRDRLQELQGVGRESNYTRLFGTPERAARTEYALEMCRVVGCEDCPARGISRVCSDFAYSEGSLLEWLESEVDG